MKKWALYYLIMALAILLGAWSAHGLANWLSPEKVDSFKTGVQYQFFQVIGLMILAANEGRHEALKSTLSKIQNLILIGMMLFSGSIYLLSLNEIWKWNVIKWLGPVTPIGGVLMIVGWLWAAVAYFKTRENEN